MFKRPPTQIDFTGDHSYDDIKKLIYNVCCSPRGEFLDYNLKSFLRLPDYTNQPVERHYDGISSIKKDRVPDWVFFLNLGFRLTDNSSSINSNCFTVSNGFLAYSNLTDNSKKLIADTHQVILNHKIGTCNIDDNDLSNLFIDLLQNIGYIPILRGHIPFGDTSKIQYDQNLFYCYHDHLTINFGHFAWTNQ